MSHLSAHSCGYGTVTVHSHPMPHCMLHRHRIVLSQRNMKSSASRIETTSQQPSVVITGASTGIGQETAVLLANKVYFANLL